MNGVATITAHDRGRADAARGRRFRQSETTRDRTAVFADVVRQHRRAVLGSCAARLWPDADAAVAAAAGVLAAARPALADPARRPGPGQLRGWLLAVADQACPGPGEPARIDGVDWAAVRARLAVRPAEGPESPERLASLRHWLERIVTTLPEPRQRMYDLFVTRGLDSGTAAAELGTTVAEVRRLRRENRHAILRAFEVTALAAEAADGPPGVGAPGCAELRQLLAEARGDDADPHEDGQHRTIVLSAALRLTLSRHLSECRPCQDRRADCMARWAPELLPVLADAELHEQVMADVQSMPELRRPGAGPGAHRRVASAAPATRIVLGRPALAAAGAGLLAALLLIALVWPGVLRGGRAAPDVASPDRNTALTSGADAPTVAGPVPGVSDGEHPQTARSAAAGVLSTLPPTATESPAASSSASVQPSVYYTVPPSTGPTSPSPSPSSSQSQPTSPTPSASAATPTPTPSRSTGTPTPTPTASTSTPTPTPTPSRSTGTPTPTPTASTSTPAPTPSGSTATPTPSASATTPTPTPSASASSPTSAAPTASSTVAPSATATS